MRYLHVAGRLFNRPLLIAEDKLNVILRVFGQQAGLDLDGLPAAQALEVSDDERSAAGYAVREGVATFGVFGPLLHRRLDAEFPSGGPMTYAEVLRAFDLAMEDDAVHTVVGLFGTSGGEVSGAFDAADHIFEARGRKTLIAVVDEEAYSAGYLLSSAFDRIVVPRTGRLGSIGVIATHADFSRAEDAAGVTVTHVYAGARKADFSPHRPLSSEALQVLQASVAEVYQLFVDTVARNRGLSPEAVRATEAGIFDPKRAIELGLADEIAAVDHALANARQGTGPQRIAVSRQTKEVGMTIEELRQQHPDLVAQLEAEARQGMIAQADADTARAEAVAGETERILGLVTAAVGEEAGKRLAAAAAKGLSAEDLAALGVSLAPAADGKQQEMLEALTAAAAPGVQGAVAKPGEAEQRKAAAAAIAAGGSAR